MTWPQRGVVLLVIAGAVTLFVFAARGADPIATSVVADSDPNIEALIPPPNTQVLAQDRIGVDVAPGYTAELRVNGVLIPPSQLLHDSGLDIFAFEPVEGFVIEELNRGEENCARATVWDIRRGRPSAGPPVEWCFQVV